LRGKTRGGVVGVLIEGELLGASDLRARGLYTDTRGDMDPPPDAPIFNNHSPRVQCAAPTAQAALLATSFGVGSDPPTPRQSCATTRMPAAASSGAVSALAPGRGDEGRRPPGPRACVVCMACVCARGRAGSGVAPHPEVAEGTVEKEHARPGRRPAYLLSRRAVSRHRADGTPSGAARRASQRILAPWTSSTRTSGSDIADATCRASQQRRVPATRMLRTYDTYVRVSVSYAPGGTVPMTADTHGRWNL
jgi:hypothetical protein